MSDMEQLLELGERLRQYQARIQELEIDVVDVNQLRAEAVADLSACRQECEGLRDKAAEQGRAACNMFDECKRAQIAEREAVKRAESAESQLTSLQAAYAGVVKALQDLSEQTTPWMEGYTNNVAELMAKYAAQALASTPPQVTNLLAVLEAVKADFPEINPNNYTHEDVVALNEWGISVAIAYRTWTGGEG